MAWKILTVNVDLTHFHNGVTFLLPTELLMAISRRNETKLNS